MSASVRALTCCSFVYGCLPSYILSSANVSHFGGYIYIYIYLYIQRLISNPTSLSRYKYSLLRFGLRPSKGRHTSNPLFTFQIEGLHAERILCDHSHSKSSHMSRFVI